MQVKCCFCTCRFTCYPGLMKGSVYEEVLQGQKIELRVMEGTPVLASGSRLSHIRELR